MKYLLRVVIDLDQIPRVPDHARLDADRLAEAILPCLPYQAIVSAEVAYEADGE